MNIYLPNPCVVSLIYKYFAQTTLQSYNLSNIANRKCRDYVKLEQQCFEIVNQTNEYQLCIIIYILYNYQIFVFEGAFMDCQKRDQLPWNILI